MLTSLPDSAVVAGLNCLSHLFVAENKNSWSELSRLYGVLLGFVVDCRPKVRRLEAQGMPSKHAEAITAAITEVLNDSLENVSDSFVSKADMQKVEMVQEANFSKFKSEVKNSQVNVILKELPIEEFGTAVGFREYSFLDNPSLSKQVKESWLDVQLCQAGTNGYNASSDLSRLGLLRFPRRSNEETFKTVFFSFKDVKVIQFVKMQDDFLGFSDKKREENFRKRVKRYVGVWCCVDNHIPGHIYYDMYWDETPNWKPFPPQTPKDDHPHW